MLKNTLLMVCLIAGIACVKSRTDECKNVPQYQVLTTSAKLWLPYSNNKSLTFENAALQRDTLDVLTLFIGDDSVYVGDQCPITRGQFVRAVFFDKKSGDTLRTQLGYQDELRIFTKSTNLLYYDTRTVLIDPTPYRKFDLTLTLDGKTFSDVLTLECSPADNCRVAGITKLYFSKSKGLIGFVRNTVLWTLR